MTSSALPLRLLDVLFQHPVITIGKAAQLLQVSHRTAAIHVGKLVSQEILFEVTGRERYRLFAAREIIRLAEANLETKFSPI